MKKVFLTAVVAACAALSAFTQNESMGYSATAYANAATGDFDPYMIGSWTHGKTQQKGSALLDVAAMKTMNDTSRFSFGFGAELVTGYTTYNDYRKWDGQTQVWMERSEGPSAIWLQQLYAEARYRGVFVLAGMKNTHAALVDDALSSGDLIEGCNARPIPQVRVGFNDFQNIPFTNGWVQIQGEVAFGKLMDDGYMKKHYNYYNYHLTLGSYYNYKRCFFRTNPAQPFSVTVGMQAAAFFGGHMDAYRNGKVYKQLQFSKSLKTFFKVFLPMGESGEDFYEGNHLGSWDVQLRYRFRNSSELKLYFQGPWEDGSGIGRMNKLDGLWGIEYRPSNLSWLKGIVIEYIDFRDQSGPIHWDPAFEEGTHVTSHASGRDDYYNNAYYNSYAYYGMSLGSPFLVSPIYNLDGYPAFACTRANGVHIGAIGSVTQTLDYRVLFSHQRGLGTYNYPYPKPRTCTSMMVEAAWDASALLPGLSAKAQVAFDAGRLRGDNFGMSLAVSYSGKVF